MRRADRLFQLVQILRNKRLVTARELAERLEVSERTIYRDMQDLSLSGVPVEGEAGVGYHLRYSLDIPPLMFSAAEILGRQRTRQQCAIRARQGTRRYSRRTTPPSGSQPPVRDAFWGTRRPRNHLGYLPPCHCRPSPAAVGLPACG